MNFDESKTKDNLARAFVAEVTGGARYQFMAKDAKANGYGFISNTLKMLAKNEMAHARVFYDFLLNKGKLGDATDCKDWGYDNIDLCFGFPFPNYVMPESLKMESDVELHECDEIYKHFEQTALDEGYQDVANAFHHVVQVEHCHHLLLKELYEKMSSGKMYRMQKMNKWKCTNCGTELTEKEAPKNCPMCGYDQGYFMVPLADN
ncbi:MAG: rubrerythrin family protein [Clostridiales bacterium]|nr:rubrerythrin family protein [Clostridiales bacterium]